MNQSQFKAMRQHMVESQLRTSDVNEPNVLATMAIIPREDFVPEDRASTAYMDRAIPLAHGRAINPPLTIGRMIVEANIAHTDKVLIIGAATGYTAAIVSHLAARVVAVEESAELAAKARAMLAGMANVTIVEGALEAGAPTDAPYDVILIDGAVEEVPPSLTTQLAEEGRCIAAVNDRGVNRLSRGVRVGDQMAFMPFADMEAVALPGFTKPKIFTF